MVGDRNDLSNAIAINASLANGARLIGPAIAGLVIGAVGEGWCFLLDGISYIAVIGSLLLMRIPQVNLPPPVTSMLGEMREGWDYVRTFRPVRSILLLFAFVNLVAYPYSILLPFFAGQVLRGNASTLGWLTAASGVGAVCSGLSLAMRESVVGLTRMLQIGTALLGVALILFGLSHTFWLSCLLMGFVGFGLMQSASVSNMIVQALVPEDKRGRLMSYYVMAFSGAAPFGNLLVGALAQRMGAPYAVIVTGALCIGGALWFLFELPKIRGAMRVVYREKGLLSVPG
jgi:MFS family permease